MSDPGDMSDQYNTPLSPEEQKGYQQWLAQLSAKNGRDMSGDVYDYDMQGAYKAGASQGGNGHFTDQFKKPNHPTFSTQSQYSGKDGNQGGEWKDLGGGKYEFHPSATNLKFYGPKSLQEYFRRVEPPEVQLVLPAGVGVQ